VGYREIADKKRGKRDYDATNKKKSTEVISCCALAFADIAYRSRALVPELIYAPITFGADP
jgi:hypothetical protein